MTIFRHVDCETQELCHDFFMGIYSFPGQFWLEKGVPFTLPEAWNPPNTGCGCPLLLFLLSTRCSLNSSLRLGGGGSPALGIRKRGSQISRVNCAGVGIAQDLWGPRNGSGIARIRRASWRRCHLIFKRRKGKSCSWKVGQGVWSGWGSTGDTAPKVRLNESAGLKAPLFPTPLTFQSPQTQSSQIPRTSA